MTILTRYRRQYSLGDGSSLLLNTLTSAIDVIDEETSDRLAEMASGRRVINAQDDPQLHQTLVKRGYLFESEEQEREILERMHQVTRGYPGVGVPHNFVICPTMGCNLRCTYCFESGQQHVTFDRLTTGQLESIYAYILECRYKLAEIRKDPAMARITKGIEPGIGLFGGEPLLRPNRDIIENILRFAASVPTPVRIITNGTQVRHFTDLIESYRETLAFQVTLDGGRESHDRRRIRANGAGTFDDICAAINTLAALEVKVAVRVNLDRENIGEIDDLRQVFQTEGWLESPYVRPYASIVQEFGCEGPGIMQESELLAALYERGAYGSDGAIFDAVVATAVNFVEAFFRSDREGFKPWKITYCEATSGSQLCFAPDGTMSTCLTYVGKGDHNVGTFDETGVHVDPEALERWTGRDPFTFGPCNDCEFLLMCGGGCPVKALERHGEIDCPVCSDIEDTLSVHVAHIRARLAK